MLRIRISGERYLRFIMEDERVFVDIRLLLALCQMHQYQQASGAYVRARVLTGHTLNWIQVIDVSNTWSHDIHA